LFLAVYVLVPLAGRILDVGANLPRLPGDFVGPGVVLGGAGLVGLAWSVTTFWIRGHGTPNPMAPPKVLVTTGPFAWMRNPIIASHFLVVLGIALVLGSPGAVGVAILLGLPARALVAHEERVLEARYGDAFRAYRASVPRWFPRPPVRHRR
jgi:protein-S-isoprenylcysteine O-methyltransferase Ste14